MVTRDEMMSYMQGRQEKRTMQRDDNQRINGMPLKTVKAMLKSPKTPEQMKRAWKEKLRLKGIVV